jgi:hypothetical protein
MFRKREKFMTKKYSSKDFAAAASVALSDGGQNRIVDELRNLICVPLGAPVEPMRASPKRMKRRAETNNAEKPRQSPSSGAVSVKIKRSAN